MKITPNQLLRILIPCLVSCLTLTHSSAQESFIHLSEEQRFSGAVGSIDFDEAYTADELAEPPIGEFKKKYLRELKIIQHELKALIAFLESKGASVNPLAITSAKDFLEGVDNAIKTRSLQSAIKLDELYDSAWPAWEWDVRGNSIDYGTHLAELLVHSCGQMCVQNNGALDEETTKKFTRSFYGISKIPWEQEGFLEGAALSKSELWISNPNAVSSTLQEMVMNGESIHAVINSIAWVENSTDILPVLKNRYQANAVVIEKSIDDFHKWHTSLESVPDKDEISKQEIISLNQETKRLGRLIDLIENGSVAKKHALYPKLRAYKAALDHLISTEKISDVMSMVLAMEPFEIEWTKIWNIADSVGTDESKTVTISALGLPEFFFDVDARLTYDHEIYGIQRVDPQSGVAGPIEEIYKRYCQSLSGVLPTELFNYEYLWVDKKQIAANESAADVFVLFPNQMFDRIKTLPLEKRNRLLVYKGDLLDTPEKFFAIFTDTTEEHPDYVIARYKANKAAIDAKFAELIQWHKAQPAK